MGSRVILENKLRVIADKLGLIINVHHGLFVIRITWQEIEELKKKGGE